METLRWEALVGHRENIARLKGLIQQEQMPHALLIVGPEGVGKFLAAQLTAAALFCCENEKPCGGCTSCRFFLAGNHPDLAVVEPEGQSIKIEQIRALQTEISCAPYLAKRRVVLLRQAETMTLPAANSLLKTLEEPPGNAVFILTAANRQMLLDTILSRCRIMVFQPLPADELTRALMDKGADAQLAATLARLSEGSFGKALRLLESDALSQRSQAWELLRQASAGVPMEAVWEKSVALGEMERGALQEVLLYLNLFFRDLLVLHGDERSILLYNADLREELWALWPHWSKRRLFCALEAAAHVQKMLKANGNQRLTMEQFLINLRDI